MEKSRDLLNQAQEQRQKKKVEHPPGEGPGQSKGRQESLPGIDVFNTHSWPRTDLVTLPQGFKSKLLHTISHLLDGFFGIDSRFFDIDEISHWCTENRRQILAQRPAECWLLRVKAQMVYGQGFEKKGD